MLFFRVSLSLPVKVSLTNFRFGFQKFISHSNFSNLFVILLRRILSAVVCDIRTVFAVQKSVMKLLSGKPSFVLYTFEILITASALVRIALPTHNVQT
jgi:hypothetical protein